MVFGRGSTGGPHLLEYVKRYTHLMIILGIVLMVILGMAMVSVSFEQADRHLPYYMIREIGKALVLTALVSTAINWYVNRQLLVFEQEKRELKSDFGRKGTSMNV